MKKGETMSREQKNKIGLANSISLKGNIPWNNGLIKENDARLDYDRPTAFKKGQVPINKGKKSLVTPWNKGKKLSQEHVEKLRGKRPNTQGDKNHNWRGGISTVNMLIRRTAEYNLWVNSVFARDRYTCQKTGIKGGKLVAHHIMNFSSYPELRHDINNGITLSEKCHKEFHRKYGIKNNTKEQLEDYLNTP